MKGRVVILGGGTSSEREVSLRSAKAVYEALREHTEAALMTLDSYELPSALDPQKDILFLTTHGTFGEDGALQALLEDRGFVYTGADSQSSQLCFDKQRSLTLARNLGIEIPEGVCFQTPPPAHALWKNLGPKIVLKPNAEGSSVGLQIVENEKSLEAALKKFDGQPTLAERFVFGREMTVGVLNGEALGVVEIIPQGGVYDYQRKYTTGETQYEFPAKIAEPIAKRLREESAAFFKASACRDFARVDFRLRDDGTPVFLEINTLPGLTATSLLPKSASVTGRDFPTLVNEMLRGARARFVEKYALAIC